MMASTDRVVVAIDGPAGSGKSSVARRVAGKLGYRLLDSGAMYRALALKALEEEVAGDDGAGLSALLEKVEIRLGEGAVLLDGRDVSVEIRTPRVSRFVSRIAALPEVRAGMVPRQRRVWPRENLVAEGRDMGSVVFPDARVKVFLTAEPEERARRRAAETGQPFEEVLAEQRERDARDAGRSHSPLVRAPGAVVVDTTRLTLDEVVAEIDRIAGEASSS